MSQEAGAGSPKTPETKAARERREHGPVNAVSFIGHVTADAVAQFPEERSPRVTFRIAINHGLFPDGTEKPASFKAITVMAVANRDADGNPTSAAPDEAAVKALAESLPKGQRVRIVGREEDWSLRSDTMDVIRDALGLSDDSKMDNDAYREVHFASTPHVMAFWSGEPTEPKRGQLRPVTLLPSIAEEQKNRDSQMGFVI